MKSVLIVDDEVSICWGLQRVVKALGHRAVTCASAEQALTAIENDSFDLAVIDVRLPGTDGLTFACSMRAAGHRFPMVIITAYGDLATAVQAVQNGAFDYLVKPFDLKAVEKAIVNALTLGDLSNAEESPTSAEPAQIVGSSPLLQEVFKRIAMVAPTEAAVHIYGESGTGKELVARAIHQYSQRKDGPFVVMHAAAINPSIAESELFGHVRGAFTGAEQNRVGLIGQAHGGTLFLDEVAEIPLELQVKLLRALEYGEVLPVGAAEPIKSRFRIISATHQNLRQRVEEGTFREDLYYRLVTFRIEVPPLRDRKQDIPELADYFLASLAHRRGVSKANMTEGARQALLHRQWVGNVRELRNAVEHAMVVARSGVILAEHFPPPELPTSEADKDNIDHWIQNWARAELRRDANANDLHRKFLDLVEQPLLEEVLKQHGDQFASAARALGLHRVTLRRKIDELRSK